MRARVVTASVVLLTCITCEACEKKAPPTEHVVEAGPKAGVTADAAVVASPVGGADAAVEAAAGGPCPDDMAYVKTSFCPDVERRCLDMEHEETNHLEICHAYAHEQRCRTEEHELAA
jgi:sulfatase modifying factor 1